MDRSLKVALASAPILTLPDFSLPFTAECDASHSGIGAVILQKGKPIAYFCKALHGKNKIMSTYNKELLALVLQVEKWKSYLLGRHFIVQTDYMSLKHL